jgi:hypothetical protein
MSEGKTEGKAEGSNKLHGIKTKFHVNDKVRRANGSGCSGVVKEVRVEVTASSIEAKEKSVMFFVAWDNGTQSFFGQEGLVAE